MSDNTPDTIAPGEPPFKEGSSSFGSFYPKHYVLAVFLNNADASAAADALRTAGFAHDDVMVASGEEVAAFNATAKAEQGLLSKIGEQWSKLYTDESADARTLMDFAKRGAAFVSAYAPDEENTKRATAVLKPLNPGLMRKYDTLSITELG